MQVIPCNAKYFACLTTKKISCRSVEKLTATVFDDHSYTALFAFKFTLSKGAIFSEKMPHEKKSDVFYFLLSRKKKNFCCMNQIIYLERDRETIIENIEVILSQNISKVNYLP